MPPVDYPDYDPNLATPPVADDELAALDALLAQLPTDHAMNVEAMDGYLTALLLGPGRALRQPARSWMPLVWGGSPDTERPGATAPFPSQRQRKRVALLVLRQLHAIDGALARGEPHWQPVFSVAEAAGEDGADLVDAEDWCAGFLHAVALDEDAWTPLFDDPALAPLLAPLVLLGGEEEGQPAAELAALADPLARDTASRAVMDAVLALQARRAGAAVSP